MVKTAFPPGKRIVSMGSIDKSAREGFLPAPHQASREKDLPGLPGSIRSYLPGPVAAKSAKNINTAVQASISCYDTSNQLGPPRAGVFRREAVKVPTSLPGRRVFPMRSRSSEPSRWYFLPPDSPNMGLSRGLGLLTLILLVFFTLGLVVAGFADGSAAHSRKSSANSVSISSPVEAAR